MMRTPEDFYKEYNGRAIDYDHAYGVQCVDGFRIFCDWAGVPSVPTPNNWADGYYLDFEDLKIYPYFEKVKAPYQNGDWIFWKRGSSSHPSSHVAMYYNGYEFGENQGGNRGFCLKKTDFSDALGGLRLKRWAVLEGWRKESGSWYYYQAGKKIRKTVQLLEWEGKKKYYAFDSDGRCCMQIKLY